MDTPIVFLCVVGMTLHLDEDWKNHIISTRNEWHHREHPHWRQEGRFRWTTRSFEQLHFLCCILYIEQWGFRFFILQVIADGVPRSSRPWAETYAVEFSTTDDLFHTLKTMWGPVTLRSVTDSTEQLVWCLMHMRSMLHDISVICYLTRICICTSYYCEMVVGLRVQIYTLLEVWGGWELGCWHLSRRRVWTPRIGGSKYRWS
jgi:hypothetical protein